MSGEMKGLVKCCRTSHYLAACCHIDHRVDTVGGVGAGAPVAKMALIATAGDVKVLATDLDRAWPDEAASLYMYIAIDPMTVR